MREVSVCRDLTAFSRPITRKKMATMANSAPASPTAHDSVLRTETGDLGPTQKKATPGCVRWYKHTVWLWLPLIRAFRNDATRAITLRQPLFLAFCWCTDRSPATMSSPPSGCA